MKRIPIARLALASCAAFVLTVAGCTRHALVARSEDAGSSRPEPDVAAVPDLATEPPVEAAGKDAVAEAGLESGRDVRPEDAGGGLETTPDLPDDGVSEGRAEVASDFREAGRESGPDTAAEGVHETGGEVGPARDVAGDLPSESILDGGSAGCPAWTSTTTLAELAWRPLPSAFLVQGDSLFVGVSDPSSDATPPNGAIVAVSISTRKITNFPLGASIPAWIVAGRDALFYLQGYATSLGGGSWSFSYPDIARLDLATGQTAVVDSELVPLGYSILSLASNTDNEVFWSMLASPSDGTSVIRRWDPGTRSAKTVMNVEQPAAVLANQDRLYWSGVASSGRIAFFSAPTTGGVVSVVHEWPVSVADAPVLAAVDGQSLYFTYPGSRPAGIFSMPKGGGDGRPVVGSADPSVFGGRSIDDTHVYWVDSFDPSNIRRAPKTGDGGFETIATGGTGQISDLVVDGCNVYWMASGKSRVLARGK